MVSLLDGRLDRLQKVGIWEKLIISKTRHQGWVRRKRPVAPFPFNFLMCLITFWKKNCIGKNLVPHTHLGTNTANTGQLEILNKELTMAEYKILPGNTRKPTNWSNTLRQLSAFADELFECVWPFSGFSGVFRLYKMEALVKNAC